MTEGPVADPVQVTTRFVRFSRQERLQHVLIILAFTALVITGLPQKFFGETWAQALVTLLGGIGTVRFVHRSFAILFCLEPLYRVGNILWLVARGRFEPTKVPGARDVRAAVQYFATILVWYFYSALLNPKHFPGDASIFSGKISREQMVEEHPLEYIRLTGRPLENLAQEGAESVKPVAEAESEPDDK
ncbi:MAG: hypothetical protein ACYC4L_04270 [Chloroflexota bacterium]